MFGNSSTPQNSFEEIFYSDSFNLDANVKVGQTFACVVILVLSLVGNSLTAAVVFKEKNPRSTVDYFILNMACPDDSFGLTGAPRRITEMLSSPYEWLVDRFLLGALSKVTYTIQDVFTAISIESLVLIAEDRFRSVVFPLKPSLGSPSVSCMFILLTSVDCGVWIPRAMIYLHLELILSRKQNPLYLQLGPIYEMPNVI